MGGVIISVQIFFDQSVALTEGHMVSTRGPVHSINNSYTMGCTSVRGDNPRASASGLSYVQVDKHGITILYHLHQSTPCTSRDISC